MQIQQATNQILRSNDFDKKVSTTRKTKPETHIVVRFKWCEARLRRGA